MSSLRRLAIWITRARSTWRSSIGGLASARTTADASFGSASRRVQATTSRTSARSMSGSASGGGLADASDGDDGGGEDKSLSDGAGTLLGYVYEPDPHDRLGHGAAGRRAGRGLASVRRSPGSIGAATRARVRAARQRLHRSRSPRASFRRWRWSTGRAGSRRICSRCDRCSIRCWSAWVMKAHRTTTVLPASGRTRASVRMRVRASTRATTVRLATVAAFRGSVV